MQMSEIQDERDALRIKVEDVMYQMEDQCTEKDNTIESISKEISFLQVLAVLNTARKR